jgi:acylphosphatase
MSEKEAVRLHAIIEGRVQGVNFRYFTRENALRLGLVGWVRNRYDGTVEVIAEGQRELLEQFLGFLRQGPRSAYVTRVTPVWGEATGEFSRFSVKRTV